MTKSIILVFLIIATTSLMHMHPLTAAQADKESNVRQTPHNLSSTGGATTGGLGDVKTTEAETEVCVFCHTPHGASSFPGSPLWNRSVNDTYTSYTSSSLDAETIMGGSLDSPAGSSKLCLSCHDGMLALGTVNVFAGNTNYTFGMTSTKMPIGEGLDTGFTRNLGTDLTNDHPIGLTYDSAVAAADGELYTPGVGVGANIALRSPGVKPLVPLEPTGSAGEGQIQCATCHDPHLNDPTATSSIKFLRLNRFQQGPPSPGSFLESKDMVCLACHDKEGWSTSAHADSAAANETYKANTAGTLREIPALMPVWQVGCLNCHDTHTVHGSRRLLREGTDGPGDPKVGGDSAIEETCYQCHSSDPIITNASDEVPDIETDFGLNRHMPIKSDDQPDGTELHDITDADFSESRALLGLGNPTNRHVECTDCHNPHRVMKDRLFSGNSGDTSEGTHPHNTADHIAPDGHTNIASGVLRGSWGVEPNYSGSDFLDLPISYTVKDGDGGVGAPAGANGSAMSYVTREYQVCLKCHSDYGYSDDGNYPAGGRPVPGDSTGTTVGANNLTEYTNQAMEFQAPVAQQNGNTGNRSWHPVIDKTGRTAGVRSMSSNNNMFLSPWGSGNIGNQTMYCSDCHGSNTGTQTVVPSGNNPWGPHGSNNNFILKGTWTASTGSGGTNDTGICFKCHNAAGYATGTHDDDDNGWESGFGGNEDSNLHAFHRNQVGKNLRCSWCHVAVVHGWKNKAFLVNLNDVGPEAGLPAGTEVSISGNNSFYNQGPYYNNAKLKIQTFSTSGTWSDGECGGSGSRGRSWMRDVCDPPGGP